MKVDQEDSLLKKNKKKYEHTYYESCKQKYLFRMLKSIENKNEDMN